jgi:hypothetical protein
VNVESTTKFKKDEDERASLVPWLIAFYKDDTGQENAKRDAF